MKVIDVHNHLYPKEWMAFLGNGERYNKLGRRYLRLPVLQPLPIGGPERVIDCIKDLGLPAETEEKVLWKNAAQLFKLTLDK